MAKWNVHRPMESSNTTRLTKHVFLMLMGLMIVMLGSVIWMTCVDNAPPDDRYLRIDWSILKPVPNPLAEFQDWLDFHPMPQRGSRFEPRGEGRPWTAQQVAKLMLPDIDPVLQRYDDLMATDTSRWRWREGEEVANPYRQIKTVELIDIAGLATARMHQLRVQHRPDLALLEAEKLLRFSDGLRTAQGNLECYEIAYFCARLALEELEFSLAMLGDDAASLRGTVKRSTVFISNDLRFAIAVEYELWSRELIDLSKAPISSRGGSLGDFLWLPVHPNHELSYVYHHLAPLSEALSEGWAAAKPLLDEWDLELVDNKPNRLARAMRGSGAIRMGTSEGKFKSVIEYEFRDQVFRQLVRLQAAIRLYELEHHMLPERLDALVPSILSELPSDPFSRSKEAYRWNRGARTIWSVGPNSVDNGGAIQADRPLHGPDVGQKYLWLRTTPVAE